MPYTGFIHVMEILENLENIFVMECHGNVMEFYFSGKVMEFYKNVMEKVCFTNSIIIRPQPQSWGPIELGCPSVRLSVRPSVRLSVRLSSLSCTG